MKPVVFGEIMDFFAEGKPVMLDEPMVTDTTILDDDDEVVAMIKELLQERVGFIYILERFHATKSVSPICVASFASSNAPLIFFVSCSRSIVYRK